MGEDLALLTSVGRLFFRKIATLKAPRLVHFSIVQYFWLSQESDYRQTDGSSGNQDNDLNRFDKGKRKRREVWSC